MNGQVDQADEAVLARLEASGAVRVARRFDIAALAVPPASGEVRASRVVGVADVETTGFAPSAKIIELAFRRVRVDGDGAIVEVGRAHEFLEDPGEPLSPEIRRLTGLRDEDLAGRGIDDASAVALLRTCEAVVCHNAAFDAPRILGRLPGLAGTPFACSLREVDWGGRGHGGSMSLRCLLCGHGLLNPRAHRAGADVDATIALLAQRDADGRTALAELLETAARPTVRFSAYGAAFGEPKDRLKARGYRWDAVARVWSREVATADEADESSWLEEHVYAPRWRPRCDGPHVETVDWSTRHA